MWLPPQAQRLCQRLPPRPLRHHGLLAQGVPGSCCKGACTYTISRQAAVAIPGAGGGGGSDGTAWLRGGQRVREGSRGSVRAGVYSLWKALSLGVFWVPQPALPCMARDILNIHVW